jgi:hypothetical protein
MTNISPSATRNQQLEGAFNDLKTTLLNPIKFTERLDGTKGSTSMKTPLPISPIRAPPLACRVKSNTNSLRRYFSAADFWGATALTASPVPQPRGLHQDATTHQKS